MRIDDGTHMYFKVSFVISNYDHNACNMTKFLARLSYNRGH